ncbi:hypothetical protein [uncultured Marixanthomonas sp.]|uniref:hypothetical protein n=1 Tax=uncultured Marixanthomonas sp. TaxID=757245 RepID=UPI0030DB924B|tara:strand:- start:25986 stop:26522 length:537 start_codon:yes stop_codon:yes gene_type:complete
MKKYIGIFLLLCLLLPSAGTYVWLTFHKKSLKKEVKWKLIAGIDKEELVLLKFSKTEIDKKVRWEHAKEFEYKGQMYDIVETNITKDSIAYWCWWDYEETKLNKDLNKIFSGVLKTDTETNEKRKRLINFYRTLFVQSKPVWQLYTAGTDTLKEKIIYSTIYYKSISFPPPETPPRIS